MTDTIELLEAIGSDASLRYAQADELKVALERAQASIELIEAVAQGNGTLLCKELGFQQTTQVQQIHAPGREDDDEDDDDDDERDPPEQERRQPDKSPLHPPAKPD